jgi:eukaryotic-like serine/threonine-protein kinase
MRKCLGSVSEEVSGLSIARKRGFVTLLLVLLAVVATGCAGSGSLSNPSWASVNVADNVVYAALPTGGRLVALDATQEGKELWSYPLPQQQKSGGFLGGLFSGGGSSDDSQKPLDSVYGTPALTDKLVLVTSFDHKLYAFDRTTGKRVWTFTTEGAIIGGATIYEGIAYFGSSDKRVYAVSVATGEAVWEKPFEAQNSIWGAPAVDAKRVYVGSMDHFVYALNRKTGVQEWQRDMGGSVPDGVTLVDGVLFTGGVDKQFRALNAETGAVLWSRPVEHWVMGEALVLDGYVYVGTLEGKVFAFKTTDGSPRWEAPATLSGAIRAAPVLVGGDLVVSTDAGTLYKVDVQTGASTVFFKSVGAVLATPIVTTDTLYIGTTLGNVYAVKTNGTEGQQAWVYPPVKK